MKKPSFRRRSFLHGRTDDADAMFLKDRAQGEIKRPSESKVLRRTERVFATSTFGWTCVYDQHIVVIVVTPACRRVSKRVLLDEILEFVLTSRERSR